MRCPKVENILIEGISEYSDVIAAQVQAHLENCSRCRRVAEDIEALRHEAALLAAADAPEAMAGSVLSRCRSELRAGIQTVPVRVPVWVGICTGFLALLTVLWVCLVLRDPLTEDSINYSTGLVITLLIQNVIMLLFTPLVIRISRDRAQKSQYWFMHVLRRH